MIHLLVPSLINLTLFVDQTTLIPVRIKLAEIQLYMALNNVDEVLRTFVKTDEIPHARKMLEHALFRRYCGGGAADWFSTWAIRYAPRTTEDMIGCKHNTKLLVEWIKKCSHKVVSITGEEKETMRVCIHTW